jgi:hypothetical protein
MDMNKFDEEIRSYADRMLSGTAAQRSQHYYAAKHRIAEARAWNKAAFDGDGYISEKLGALESHLAVIAGLDEWKGHDSDSHQDWVLGALDAIKLQLAVRNREKEANGS